MSDALSPLPASAVCGRRRSDLGDAELRPFLAEMRRWLSGDADRGLSARRCLVDGAPSWRVEIQVCGHPVGMGQGSARAFDALREAIAGYESSGRR